MSSNNTTIEGQLSISYTSFEATLAILTILGNALVIYVFIKERRLRQKRTNYYIVSLAVADLFVGLLGIPFAILSSVGLPNGIHICLFTVSLLVVLCTISIFSLVAVSVDRYWAILHPMGYSIRFRTKTALVIISICWVAGFLIGLLPLMGWHQVYEWKGCYFLKVMSLDYLVFLYFGTIIIPALVLAAFYAHIYQVVLKQLRRKVTMNTDSSSACTSGGTMLRVLGAARKREVKATQNLAIIVLFFMICWIPLYTINSILAFCKDCYINQTLMDFCIILSHVNSAVNPVLYAYHLKDFRVALKNFFCGCFIFSRKRECVQSQRVTLVTSKYSPYRFRRKFNITDSMFLDDSIELQKKVNAIVRNPTTVAFATTGNTDSSIWKIPDDRVGEIIRHPTPYRPRKSSFGNHYQNEDSSAEDDEVFLDDCTTDIKLIEKDRVQQKFSASSPQLADLLLLENDCRSLPVYHRSLSQNEEVQHSPSKRKISPFKAIGNYLGSKIGTARSLSIEDNFLTDDDKNKTVTLSSAACENC